MRWPWVSRAAYDLALAQIEELKASNANLLDLALQKTAAIAAAEKQEDEPQASHYKPRRLVKELRAEAEFQALERHRASSKAH